MYVGGKPSTIAHCRKIVEEKGGIFLHHDGGIEDNFSILSNKINKADKVFCPLDCVSHNASLVVKKICKQNEKEFIMLKSSGLSSFSRAIN